MVIFRFTKYAHRIFNKLPSTVRSRTLQKLTLLKDHPDIFKAVMRLQDIDPPKYKVRIGNYRLILHLSSQEKNRILFHIVDAGHRKDIYRSLK